MSDEAQRPIELFYSYAQVQADEKLRKKVEKHLTHLVQQQQITPWHQQKIIPGQNRVQEIDTHLNTAQIILLLVSADFLASDYCYGQEMQRAIERHNTQQACVIPILLRPVDWQGTPLGELEPLPSNRKPITSWSNQDEALLDVALGIRSAVDDFKKKQIVQVQQEEVKPMEQQSTNQPPPINGQERPATVFLSYAREDTEDVRDLQLRLNVRGVRCWRDVDSMLTGSVFENEIVHAIEREADAIALFLTPDSLKSDFIWRVEVPAALRRHEHDSHFHIVPILLGVSFEDVRQHCFHRNLPDLSRFNGISLSGNGVTRVTKKVQNEKRNDAARRILEAAFALRLRRINADRSYEPSLYLRTFVFAPSMTALDLYLDWLKPIYEKEQISTPQTWDEILWPALLDVKHTISEKIFSRRLHLTVKAILPVAIALGFVFRESTRMTLLLEGQKEIWSTEAPVSEKAPLLQEWRYIEHGDQQVAVVEVATSRSTRQGVANTLPTVNLVPAYHVVLEAPEFSRESVRDATHARAIAQQVGQLCQNLCDKQGVRHLHLFVAIPVELAVLIGHQLNALCPLTVYEFKNEERIYKPVGTLRQ